LIRLVRHIALLALLALSIQLAAPLLHALTLHAVALGDEAQGLPLSPDHSDAFCAICVSLGKVRNTLPAAAPSVELASETLASPSLFCLSLRVSVPELPGSGPRAPPYSSST
jgi:hypothetical protein